ncbi:MAG: hypothetical protein G01um101429_624 [Parcubacteria group bacterium Gr01-1014_29]|nr:MAG: hypothetical protein G01um101429_624 [Parcubacteria group bacterium Gr01-1014_29]
MLSNQKRVEWSLRLGLAAMFGYSGVDILLHPTAWHWAVRGLPAMVQDIINAVGFDTYLRLQGASELLFALVFLLWFWPRLTRVVALLAAIEMAAILLMVGVDSITFRDFGPLGAAVALFFLL